MRRLGSFERSRETRLAALQSISGNNHTLRQLTEHLHRYRRLVSALIEWPSVRTVADGREFLQRRLAPQRNVLLQVLTKLDQLSRGSAGQRRQSVLRAQAGAELSSRGYFVTALVMGIARSSRCCRTNAPPRSLECSFPFTYRTRCGQPPQAFHGTVPRPGRGAYEGLA